MNFHPLSNYFSASSILFSKLTEKNIRIGLFSGTGNTTIVTQELQKILEQKHGKNVEIFPIEKTNPADFLIAGKQNSDYAYGLCCTTAWFSTYPLVWEFLRNLRINAEKKPKMFMMTTMAGHSGALFGPMKREAKKLGFEPFAARGFLMPENLVYFYPKSTEIKLIKRAKSQVEVFADEMIEGKAKWPEMKSMKFFSNLLYKTVSSNPRVWNYTAKGIKIDEKECSKCQICVNLCPMHSYKPIKVENKVTRIEKLENKCIACMRCVSYCPDNAIWGLTTKKRYQPVDLQFIQKSISAPKPRKE